MNKDPSTPSPTVQKRRIRWVARILIGLAIMLLTGEIAVRVLNPTPRVQIVRVSDYQTLEIVDDIPVWKGRETEGRERLNCLATDPTYTVAAVGSSIFFGSGVKEDEVFLPLIQSKLNQTTPSTPTCILNFAQPGYAFEGKLVRAKQAIETYKPDLLLFEIWHNDISQYTFLNGTAYNVNHLKTNSRSHPDLLGLPLSINGWLLNHSRLFEYASLALATRPPEEIEKEMLWKTFTENRFLKAVSLSRESGVPFLFVLCPKLDVPLASQADEENREYSEIRRYLEKEGLPHVVLSDALRGEAVEEIRYDPCCHLNPLGMEKTGEVIYPLVREMLPKAK